MNAAGSRAPRAAGEGSRLAPGGSPLPRRRGPGQLAASERPAAPASAPPAAAPGRASGCRLRRRWASLLLFGLLVAGAADGCDLVPRHLRGRRASGSAGAAASPSAAAAAGERQALLTGEARAVAGRLGGIPPGRTPSPPRGRPAVALAPAVALGTLSLSTRLAPRLRLLRPVSGFPASFPAERCTGFSFVLPKGPLGSGGDCAHFPSS